MDLRADHLPACRGTYLLVLQLAVPLRVAIGALGCHELPAGRYAYVGSAFGPGGVRARVRHHLHSTARPRWHLDYLRHARLVEDVWFTCDTRRRELLWSRILAGWPGITQPVPGFGAADFPARGPVKSHLFHCRVPLTRAGFAARLARRAPRHAPVLALRGA